MTILVVQLAGGTDRVDPADVEAALAPIWCGDVHVLGQVTTKDEQTAADSGRVNT